MKLLLTVTRHAFDLRSRSDSVIVAVPWSVDSVVFGNLRWMKLKSTPGTRSDCCRMPTRRP